MDTATEWLLDGDVSIQYLTHLYLLDSPSEITRPLQARIGKEGYGLRFLSCRGDRGHWGLWFYQPKWTCTHYTLMDMKDIGMPRDVAACREMVTRAFDECMLANGGINFAKTLVQSDVAVDGMILNYAAYFCPDEERVDNLVEYIISQGKADGGYSWDTGSEVSDPHTTICVLEGFSEYRRAGFTKLVVDIEQSESRARDWLLSRKLLISQDKRFQKLSFPYRYRYDVLRALEYLALEKAPFDERMAPALEWLASKKDATGRWRLENSHRGKVHFDLETRGMPSRCITLKAMLVQKRYGESGT